MSGPVLDYVDLIDCIFVYKGGLDGDVEYNISTKGVPPWLSGIVKHGDYVRRSRSFDDTIYFVVGVTANTETTTISKNQKSEFRAGISTESGDNYAQSSTSYTVNKSSWTSQNVVELWLHPIHCRSPICIVVRNDKDFADEFQLKRISISELTESIDVTAATSTANAYNNNLVSNTSFDFANNNLSKDQTSLEDGNTNSRGSNTEIVQNDLSTSALTHLKQEHSNIAQPSSLRPVHQLPLLSLKSVENGLLTPMPHKGPIDGVPPYLFETSPSRLLTIYGVKSGDCFYITTPPALIAAAAAADAISSPMKKNNKNFGRNVNPISSVDEDQDKDEGEEKAVDEFTPFLPFSSRCFVSVIGELCGVLWVQPVAPRLQNLQQFSGQLGEINPSTESTSEEDLSPNQRQFNFDAKGGSNNLFCPVIPLSRCDSESALHTFFQPFTVDNSVNSLNNNLNNNSLLVRSSSACLNGETSFLYNSKIDLDSANTGENPLLKKSKSGRILRTSNISNIDIDNVTNSTSFTTDNLDSRVNLTSFPSQPCVLQPVRYRAPVPPFVAVVKVNAERTKATCVGPFKSTITCDIRPTTLANCFGVIYTEKLCCRRGVEAGRFCRVVGVFAGNLYVLYEFAPSVSPVRHCSTAADLKRQFWMPNETGTAAGGGSGASHQENLAANSARQKALSRQQLLSIVPSKHTLLLRNREYGYLGNSKEASVVKGASNRSFTEGDISFRPSSSFSPSARGEGSCPPYSAYDSPTNDKASSRECERRSDVNAAFNGKGDESGTLVSANKEQLHSLTNFSANLNAPVSSKTTESSEKPLAASLDYLNSTDNIRDDGAKKKIRKPKPLSLKPFEMDRPDVLPSSLAPSPTEEEKDELRRRRRLAASAAAASARSGVAELKKQSLEGSTATTPKEWNITGSAYDGEAELKDATGIEKGYFDFEEASSPVSPRFPESKRYFWTAFGRAPFNTGDADISKFGSGLYYGRVVLATRGSAYGCKFTIIGTRMGILWVLQEGSAHVIPLLHCYNKEQLQKMYGFVPTDEVTCLKHLSNKKEDPAKARESVTVVDAAVDTSRAGHRGSGVFNLEDKNEFKLPSTSNINKNIKKNDTCNNKSLSCSSFNFDPHYIPNWLANFTDSGNSNSLQRILNEKKKGNSIESSKSFLPFITDISNKPRKISIFNDKPIEKEIFRKDEKSNQITSTDAVNTFNLPQEQKQHISQLALDDAVNRNKNITIGNIDNISANMLTTLYQKTNTVSSKNDEQTKDKSKFSSDNESNAYVKKGSDNDLINKESVSNQSLIASFPSYYSPLLPSVLTENVNYTSRNYLKAYALFQLNRCKINNKNIEDNTKVDVQNSSLIPIKRFGREVEKDFKLIKEPLRNISEALETAFTKPLAFNEFFMTDTLNRMNEAFENYIIVKEAWQNAKNMEATSTDADNALKGNACDLENNGFKDKNSLINKLISQSSHPSKELDEASTEEILAFMLENYR